MTLDILYQDEELVAINKPSGLLVHRSKMGGREEDAVVQILRDQIGQFVFPVHRLDRATSGTLLVALSPEGARRLGQQFSDNTTRKIYHCLVRGHTASEGVIDEPLPKLNEQKGRARFKIEGTEKEAQTEFRLLQQFQLPLAVSRYQETRCSWLEVSPKQGRLHQIRRHFRHARHPLIGDSRYGCRHHNKVFREWNPETRLTLHASELHFQHPFSGLPTSIRAPLSPDLQALLQQLSAFVCPHSLARQT